ncbi:PIG-L family deacetylase [Streptomyces sp. G-G2]|uniref:PIG-L family deacetylase n=1 Tax=Streptomyces sp. G-G2 TaxID=3046201 RepID=UPI0024BAEA0C|nr:PIG-L family deacetylase [Streptomyces sp. G-G2]MDJ0382980.1 PIG-L family deacetylase [Streptomyces sp. G-G2]
MPVSRRIRLATLLTVLTAGATGVFAVAHGEDRAPGSGPGGATPVERTSVVPPSTTAGSVVQFVAHPDDDLFFMNPDLSRSLLSGRRVTSTYLTSGEADGKNEAATPPFNDPVQPANMARYAEARQNGIRSAYAEMATGSRTSAWKRSVIPTAGGGWAELDVLVAKPQINLIWMQLTEARSTADDRPQSLRGLWNGKTPTLPSLLASGTPVKQTYAYTKDQVIQAISGILEQYQPTTIRMQDPTPGRYTKDGKITDHQDHMYGARFVQAATERYAEVAARPHFSVQNYLGYGNSALPHSLDPETAEAKINSIKTYAWLDRTDYCGSPSGCGDRKVAPRPAGHNWAQSIRYSRGEETSWLAEGVGGRLWAFSALDGRMAYWTRTGPQAEWAGPQLLPGSGIDPGATAARLPDGRIAVFGTRTTTGTPSQGYRREAVYAVQGSPDGTFGAWQVLGTPDGPDDSSTSDLGGPAVTVGADGRLSVYVRDSDRTLRMSEQQSPGGAFGPWEKLGGSDLQGDPVAVTDAAGRHQVYAATAKTVLAWTQQTPGGPLQGPFATDLPATTGPLSATAEGDRVRLYFRRPDSGTVRSALITAGGPKPVVSHVVEVGGRAGYGAVSVAGRLLTGRADTGTISTTGLGGAPAWTESQMLYAGAPASVLDAAGATTTVVLGLDAELHATTTLPDIADLSRSTRPVWRLAVSRP